MPLSVLGAWARDKRIPLDEMVAERLGCPDTEVNAALGVDAVADGDDGIQIVVSDVATDLSAPLSPNYREFLGSCLLRQLLLPEGVLEVEPDVI